MAVWRRPEKCPESWQKVIREVVFKNTNQREIEKVQQREAEGKESSEKSKTACSPWSAENLEMKNKRIKFGLKFILAIKEDFKFIL